MSASPASCCVFQKARIRHGALPHKVYEHCLPELKELMRQGVGKDASLLPDDQNFNLGDIRLFGE